MLACHCLLLAGRSLALCTATDGYKPNNILYFFRILFSSVFFFSTLVSSTSTSTHYVSCASRLHHVHVTPSSFRRRIFLILTVVWHLYVSYSYPCSVRIPKLFFSNPPHTHSYSYSARSPSNINKKQNEKPYKNTTFSEWTVCCKSRARLQQVTSKYDTSA